MKKTIRCVLLDEDEDQLTLLKSKLQGIAEINLVAVFTNPLEFLNWHDGNSGYDLLISDIEMPGFDGFEVANHVAPKPVLFVTGFPEKGIDYSSVSNAIGAIKKPVKLDALQRLISSLKIGSENITLKTNRAKLEEINLSEVAYIKTEKDEPRDKVIHFRNGTKLTAKNISLDELIDMVRHSSFIKANKQVIINTNHIAGLVSVHEIGIAIGQGIEAIEITPPQKELIAALKPHLFRSK